jgi:ketosteroid isomerase-like protein
MEKTDGYSLKETNVPERRRMIMKVLVSALFAVAVVIPPALADKREDAYAGVERWSEAFNAGDVEQIVRMYTNDALVLGILSPGMTSRPDDLRAYFKAAADAKLQVKLGDHSAIAVADDAVAIALRFLKTSGGRPTCCYRCTL